MVSVLDDKSKSEISTLKRRENLFDKILKSGKSINEVKSLSLKDYNELMGTNVGARCKTEAKKQVSLKAQHRLLDQLNTNVKQVANYHIEKSKIVDKPYREFIHKRSRELLAKEGQYNIVEVSFKDGSVKWIKYDNDKAFQYQLGKIKEAYGSAFELIFHDYKKYASFIDKTFKALVKAKGIKI